MTETTKPTGLEALRKPFEAHLISQRPQPLKKDAPKGRCPECGGWHALPAIHLDYVGHAALTSRLLDVDPNWNWEPVAFGEDGLPLFDGHGGLWIKLTVCGQTRLGYGDAEGKRGPDAVKEAIGDALRNAAMRFGAALDLWHKGELHPPQLSPEGMTEAIASFRGAKTLEDLIKVASGAGEFADEEQRKELRSLFTECKKALMKEGNHVDESGERGRTDNREADSAGQVRNTFARNQGSRKATTERGPADDGSSEGGASGTERGNYTPTASGDGLP